MIGQRCEVVGCVRLQKRTQHLCPMHSERLRKTGDVGSAEPTINVGSGWSMTSDGYIRRHQPDHPLADTAGWVLEHRMFAYDAGLLTDLSYHVHHKDEDKTNNALDNLVVMSSSEHATHHFRKLDYDAIAAAYVAGLTTIEVAAAFRTYPGNVSRILKRVGVPARRP